MASGRVQRWGAVALTLLLAAPACSGGGDDTALEVDGSSSTSTAPPSTTASTTTTTTVEVGPTTTVAEEGADDDGARRRRRNQRIAEGLAELRRARRERARRRAEQPPPPPPPAPAPAPAPAPPPVDPVEAQRFRFIPICEVEHQHGLLDIIDGTDVTASGPMAALEVLPELLDPLLAFYDDARDVAPFDLDEALAVLDPFIAELRTTLRDLEAVGVVAGDEAWFEAVVDAVLSHDGVIDSLLFVLSHLDSYC